MFAHWNRPICELGYFALLPSCDRRDTCEMVSKFGIELAAVLKGFVFVF
jgi:hypothetical protein